MNVNTNNETKINIKEAETSVKIINKVQNSRQTINKRKLNRKNIPNVLIYVLVDRET